MTVLVTGSSGFVGRAIMARLPDAIGLDPVAGPSTRVIDDLSDRARLRDLQPLIKDPETKEMVRQILSN